MPIDWLGQMPNAMISVILVGAWKYFPFVVISVLARLQTIPDHLYEAATIDGAGAWGRFFDITLPQLRDVLFIVILLRAIWDFKEFDLIYLLTGGGPVDLDPDAAAARLQAGLRAERDGRRLGGRRADDARHAGLHDPVLPLRPADGELSDEALAPCRTILFNLFAWTIVVVVSFPLIWMVVTSLKPQTELFRIPPSLLPEHGHVRALRASS